MSTKNWGNIFFIFNLPNYLLKHIERVQNIKTPLLTTLNSMYVPNLLKYVFERQFRQREEMHISSFGTRFYVLYMDVFVPFGTNSSYLQISNQYVLKNVTQKMFITIRNILKIYTAKTNQKNCEAVEKFCGESSFTRPTYLRKIQNVKF